MSPARRLALAALAVVALVPSVAATPDAVQAATDPIAAAETLMLRLMATDRRDAGLVQYRPDSRLMALARQRSQEMAATGLFSHRTPDGGSVFDRLTARRITWYGAGEIIAWNTAPDGDTSARMALGAWLRSSGHRAILRSRDYNYIGVGLAVAANGRRYWTGIAMKGPDRSGAVGRVTRVARASTGTATTVPVVVRWGGSDLRLQVLTAGLRDFQVQRRMDGGSWRTLRSATTGTRLSLGLSRGHRWEFRVRARDRKGTYGGWSKPIAIDL